MPVNPFNAEVSRYFRIVPGGVQHVTPGDSPVPGRVWSEEEPEEPEPFGLNEVNQRLAALGQEPA